MKLNIINVNVGIVEGSNNPILSHRRQALGNMIDPHPFDALQTGWDDPIVVPLGVLVDRPDRLIETGLVILPVDIVYY